MKTKDKVSDNINEAKERASKSQWSSIDPKNVFPKKMEQVDKIISNHGLPNDMKDWR